ncbi:molybdopterin oxidoreductase [Opitutaceae bacterium EW11]|nr:molybdopterin oxidoreductase [Opitutaceae bacterium EW11]
MPGTSTDDSTLPSEASSSRFTRTLVDDYLAEQQRLQTPVQRASEAFDRAERSATSWSELIPLSRPSPGEQYAFEVDLDRCTGCKACVAGCHSLNGLDEDETWRDVGLVVGGTRSQPFQQTITTACHHCADPGCLNGCPVLAYEKDPVTGIVRHLDDQCIGCQYCVLKCPYDVPKYSGRLGIVRKCDLCHGRLAAGEAPACVQACPTQAIRIATAKVDRTSGTPSVDTSAFLALAPSPDYTQPTTRYISRRTMPANAAPADAAALRPQPAHWPLVIMLTFIPMAVGTLAPAISAGADPRLALIATLAGVLGLAASVFHLGQPRRAWRIFLGLRRSWLSREAVVFGVWFPFVLVFAAFRLTAAGHPSASRLAAPVGIAAIGLGVVGLACSVMIYVDTHRRFWRLSQTAPRFFGTAALFGCAAAFAVQPTIAAAISAGGVALAKVALELRTLRVLDEDEDEDRPSTDRKTALLLTGALRPVFSLRMLSALGLAACAVAFTAGAPTTFARWLIPALALSGELAERYLFFRAVVAPKMPGGPSA